MAAKLSVFLILVVLAACASAQTMIANCVELQNMKNDLAGNYALANDIDCSATVGWNGGQGFEPVGSDATPFRGTFSGQNYQITSLVINRPTTDYIGVFAKLENASLAFIKLIDLDVSGQKFVGSLAGKPSDLSEIRNCFAQGAVSGTDYVGGLVGQCAGAALISITSSQAIGTVTATNTFAGGLAGSVNNCVLSDSYASTDVIGSATAGGLVGVIGSSTGRIERSFASGSISGATSIGGLVGWSNEGVVSQCYANVAVSGESGLGGLVGRPLRCTIEQSYARGNLMASVAYVGGLVGDNDGSTITESYSTGVPSAPTENGGLIARTFNGGTATNCYWDTTTSTIGTSSGGTGKTTTQMQQQSTFSGWDFSSVWWIDAGNNYPKLRALTPPSLQNPILDQDTFASVAFSFTIPGNTFFDFTDPMLDFSAKLANDASLPAWLVFTANNQTFSGWPSLSDRANYSIEVTACDDMSLCETDSFILSVNTRVPLLSNPLAEQRFSAEEAFSFQVPSNMFSDADGDSLIYSATLQGGASLPAWVNFNPSTRTFSGTMPTSQSTPLAITVRVDDGFGGQADDTFELSINLPPIEEGFVDNKEATVDNPFLFTFSPTLFSEPDGDPLTYNATQTNTSPLPTWLTLDAGTRTFFGTPMASDQGFLFVLLIASDPYGGSASISFGIAISDLTGNNPPLLAISMLDQTTNNGELWTFAVPLNTFDDTDDDPLTYVATLEGGAPLPGWLTFDDQSQTFSGVPTVIEVMRITVRVDDGRGGFALDTFTLTVQDATNQLPVLLNQLPNQNVKVDSRFSYTVPADTFTDPNGDELTYTATQSGDKPLPGWLKFDAPTRTFSGKPSNTDTETYADRTHTLQVCASDGEGSACSSFLLAVVGASEAQEAITALIVLGSIGSAAFGAYTNRAWLWNTFAKKKYKQPTQIVNVGDSFTYKFALASSEVEFVKAFENGHNLPDGLQLPKWLTFDRDTMTLSGTPTKTQTLWVCARGHDGRNREAFMLCSKDPSDGVAMTTFA